MMMTGASTDEEAGTETFSVEHNIFDIENEEVVLSF